MSLNKNQNSFLNNFLLFKSFKETQKVAGTLKRLFFQHIFLIICFGLKKANKEISTTGEEIKNIFFQEFFYKLSFGQRPQQCLSKFKKICNSHGKQRLK